MCMHVYIHTHICIINSLIKLCVTLIANNIKSSFWNSHSQVILTKGFHWFWCSVFIHKQTVMDKCCSYMNVDWCSACISWLDKSKTIKMLVENYNTVPSFPMLSDFFAELYNISDLGRMFLQFIVTCKLLHFVAPYRCYTMFYPRVCF